MCLDILAPGSAITLPFLHQQVWYKVGHKRLDVMTYCDCFLTNQGDNPIERLRLHFSSYVTPSQVTISSGSEIPTECKSSWYGHFTCGRTFLTPASRVTLRPAFEDCENREHTGRILKGSFQPYPPSARGEGLIPVAGDSAAVFMQHMRELDLMVLDLHLDPPLEGGDTGWLRLRIEKPHEMNSTDIVSLAQFPLLQESSHFLTQREFLCPLLLGEKVRRCMEQAPYRRWQPEVIVHGLDKEGTLRRIEDHRITLVFPNHVQTCDVGSWPYETIIPVAPYLVPTAPDHFALHVLTGSRINHNRDVVAIAKRVLNYLRTVYPKATIEHLVNRFGADQQEAVGVLIEAMIATGLLEEHDGESRAPQGREQPCYRPVNEDAEPGRLVDLRKHYTRLARAHRESNHAIRIRDVHPFRIGFSMCWQEYSVQDRNRLELLNAVIRYLEASRPFAGPRRAVVVACHEYDNYHSPEVVRGIAERLCQELRAKGHFVVSPVFNPESSEAVTDVVHETLSKMGQSGTFLFWFLGHGMADPSQQNLHLLHKRSKANRGVEYSQINRGLSQHLGVQKIVVLDCCHAALALREAAPENTLIWPTAEATEGASLDKECGVVISDSLSPPNAVRNFTHAVVSILTVGDRQVSQPVFTCRQLFAKASGNSPYHFRPGQHGLLDDIPMAINVAHGEPQLEDLLQRVPCPAVV